jgi:hypothetical protein
MPRMSSENMLLWETSQGKAMEVAEKANELSVADPRAASFRPTESVSR